MTWIYGELWFDINYFCKKNLCILWWEKRPKKWCNDPHLILSLFFHQRTICCCMNYGPRSLRGARRTFFKTYTYPIYQFWCFILSERATLNSSLPSSCALSIQQRAKRLEKMSSCFLTHLFIFFLEVESIYSLVGPSETKPFHPVLISLCLCVYLLHP